ncbi:MAG: hypothetical protein FJ145_16225 [Deltaproteobacteria bacterium]|nr:hypothetical protein [Deltaproteobacteria bacterium]
MENVANIKRICVACNEDGFGPSVFAYYIVRGLLDSWLQTSEGKSSITILNRAAESFNRKLYEGHAVDIAPVASLIRLAKPKGEVHVQQTLNLLEPYASLRKSYAKAVRELLEGCDVAIDIGVPLFVRAAAQLGVPHRLTVVDHSWAATLRLITSEAWQDIYRENPKPGAPERLLAQRIASHVEEDEALATEVFLFQTYITPDEFVTHWKTLGFTPKILNGVLGTRVSQADAYAKLDTTLAEYGGQTPVPRNRPLILLSPGGTPVWDDQLPSLLEQMLAAPEQGYVAVLSKDLETLLDRRADLKKRIFASDRIRYFGPISGATQQAILPAFRRVITRAGGGTVNDAIAAGVPMTFIEEPQAQVKLIERECIRLGLSGPAATLEEFRADPKRCIDRLVGMTLPLPKVAPAPNAEQMVVQRVQSLIR